MGRNCFLMEDPIRLPEPAAGINTQNSLMIFRALYTEHAIGFQIHGILSSLAREKVGSRGQGVHRYTLIVIIQKENITICIILPHMLFHILRKVADGQSERLRCLELEFPQITLFGTGTDIDRMSLSIVRERYGRHVAVIIFLVRG